MDKANQLVAIIIQLLQLLRHRRIHKRPSICTYPAKIGIIEDFPTDDSHLGRVKVAILATKIMAPNPNAEIIRKCKCKNIPLD